MQKLNWSASESALSTSPVATKVDNMNTLRNLKKNLLKQLKTYFLSFYLCACPRAHMRAHLNKCFFSVVQLLSRVWLTGNPMDCSMPGFPVLHHLLELAQTHVHWVGDAIQPSSPLSSPFPLALNLSQNQSLFQWVSCSHQVAKGLEHQSFSISPYNEYSGLISFRIEWFDLLAVQGLSRVFSSTTVWKQQFSSLILLYGPTLTSNIF